MYSYLLCWILILITGLTTTIGAIEPEYVIGFLNLVFGGASLTLAFHILLKPDKTTKLKNIVDKADREM